MKHQHYAGKYCVAGITTSAAILAAVFLGVPPTTATGADTRPAATASAPAATQPATVKIVLKHFDGKAREAVKFTLEGKALPGGPTFAVGQVVRNGQSMFALANMKLDGNTGAFTWAPMPSQAGTYDVTFLVRQEPPRAARQEVRRIVAEAGPVTTDGGEVGKLLKQWFAQGTAAGNIGDFYDNRDREHSGLNMGKFPQLDKVVYPPQLLERRMDWALQLNFLYNHITFGNSSTSSGPTDGGCNSRRAVLSQPSATVIYQQYIRSHVYMYPEHRDHDPGRNGRGGHGDMFPANAPYIITSQGSSGSDQPFMEAVAFTLAAFRPAVKQKLAQAGLLMPTIQMIFRACNKNVKYPDDYLTGKAHPTVFEGGNVNHLAMIKMAHDMTAETIPPMIQLAVVDEDKAVEGRDYFDPGRTETLFNTPAAIARIVRSTKYVHRIVVSAKASFDANKRPLKFHWAVLRGDAKAVRINPRNPEASEVEILIPFHEMGPIAPGAALESARVDVGAFVHNGTYYSAPAFVCSYSLGDEVRTYTEDGRIVEVAYGCGDPTIGYAADDIRDRGYDVPDWKPLLDMLAGEDKALPAALLRKQFDAKELTELGKAAKEFGDALAKEDEPSKADDAAEQAAKKVRKENDEAKKSLDGAKKKLEEAKKAAQKKPADAGATTAAATTAATAAATKPGEPATQSAADVAKAAVDAAEKLVKDTDGARKEADKKANDAHSKLREAKKPAAKILTDRREALAGCVKDRVEKALNAIKDDPALCLDNAQAIADLLAGAKDDGKKRDFHAARDELVKLGVLAADGKGGFRLAPVVDGPKPPAQRLTNYERNRIQWLNIAAMRNLLYPGSLNLTWRENFVPLFVATPKRWRDVYHYDAKNNLIGWTRYDKAEKKEFTADGHLVVKTDNLGRCVEANKVSYMLDNDDRGRPREVKYITLPTVIRYEYSSDSDRVGKATEGQWTMAE